MRLRFHLTAVIDRLILIKRVIFVAVVVLREAMLLLYVQIWHVFIGCAGDLDQALQVLICDEG